MKLASTVLTAATPDRNRPLAVLTSLEVARAVTRRLRRNSRATLVEQIVAGAFVISSFLETAKAAGRVDGLK